MSDSQTNRFFSRSYIGSFISLPIRWAIFVHSIYIFVLLLVSSLFAKSMNMIWAILLLQPDLRYHFQSKWLYVIWFALYWAYVLFWFVCLLLYCILVSFDFSFLSSISFFSSLNFNIAAQRAQVYSHTLNHTANHNNHSVTFRTQFIQYICLLIYLVNFCVLFTMQPQFSTFRNLAHFVDAGNMGTNAVVLILLLLLLLLQFI